MRANIEAGLKRRHGMPDEQKEEVKKFNEAQTDWYAYCVKCGIKRTGSLAELRKPCECKNDG